MTEWMTDATEPQAQSVTALWLKHSFSATRTWSPSPAPPLCAGVTLGKLLHFSEPVSHLQNGDNDNTPLKVLR